jgi:hypothetical protein
MLSGFVILFRGGWGLFAPLEIVIFFRARRQKSRMEDDGAFDCFVSSFYILLGVGGGGGETVEDGPNTKFQLVHIMHSTKTGRATN